MEGDEWPDAVASLTPCWAVYNFTHILYSKDDHTEGMLVGTCPRGCYAHGVTQASALADNETFGYLLPQEMKLSSPAAMPSLPTPAPPSGDIASALCHRGLEGVRENLAEKAEQQLLGLVGWPAAEPPLLRGVVMARHLEAELLMLQPCDEAVPMLS